MDLHEYCALVKRLGGRFFGKTPQNIFIEQVNNDSQGITKRFISSISETLLKRRVFSAESPISTDGICNGLVQALYLQLTSNKDKESALKMFAEQMDSFDSNLARRAASLQSFNHESYSNLHHYIFRKTLGLDLDNEKIFQPYSNQKVNELLKTIQKSLLSQSHQVFVKEDPSSCLSRLAEYMCQQDADDLIRISLSFYQDERPIASKGLNGHAMLFYKYRDGEGELKYIFYDPNAVPVIFDEQQQMSEFLIQYLNDAALELKNMLSADSVDITIGRYTNDQYFHKKMHNLIDAIQKRKVTVSDQDYKKQLEILIKKCEYADTIGKYYNPDGINHFSGNTEFSMLLNNLLSSIDVKKKSFYSNKVLIDMIKEDIQKLTNIDPNFIHSLVQEIEENTSSESLNRQIK